MVHAKLAVGETQVFLPRDLNFKHMSWGLVCMSYLSVIAYSCFFFPVTLLCGKLQKQGSDGTALSLKLEGAAAKSQTPEAQEHEGWCRGVVPAATTETTPALAEPSRKSFLIPLIGACPHSWRTFSLSSLMYLSVFRNTLTKKRREQCFTNSVCTPSSENKNRWRQHAKWVVNSKSISVI